MIVSVPVYLSENVVRTKVEVQIRTMAMDVWASLEHKMNYKLAGKSPVHISRELKECADIVAFLDRKMQSLYSEIQEYNLEICPAARDFSEATPTGNDPESMNKDEVERYLGKEIESMFGDISS